MAKTTPFTTIGTEGAARSRESHAGTSESVPFASLICHAAIAPFVTEPLLSLKFDSDPIFPAIGAKIQRRPPTSWKVAIAPDPMLAFPPKAGVLAIGLW